MMMIIKQPTGHVNPFWGLRWFKFLLMITIAFCLISADVSTIQYIIQPGTPVAIQNFVSPEAGCNWSGIGGQVFDRKRTPVDGLVVVVRGTLEGKEVNIYVLTGSSQQLGPGGFDISLADHPVASQGTITLQLQDLSGVPLSAAIPMTTYGECTKNLVLVNIVQVPLSYQYRFPIVPQNSGPQ